MKLNLDFREVSLGEDVTAEICPLSLGGFQKVLKLFSEAMPDGDFDLASLKTVSIIVNKEMFDVAKEVFPEHVRNLKGIEITEKNGTREGKIDDLTSKAALSMLAANLLAQLMTISMLTESEEKNSGGPQVNSEKDPDSSVPELLRVVD